MRSIETALENTWSFDPQELKSLVAAMGIGSRDQMIKAICSLESIFTDEEDQLACCKKYKNLSKELKAKLGALKDILLDQNFDPGRAYEAYQEAKNLIDSIIGADTSDQSEKEGGTCLLNLIRLTKPKRFCFAQQQCMKVQDQPSPLSDIAKDLVDKLGPTLECWNQTDHPRFPKHRKDICVVRRQSAASCHYGFDTIYLVWLDWTGRAYHAELINSSLTRDYINIRGIEQQGEDVVVELESAGAFSRVPWSKNFKIPLEELEVAN